MNQSEVADVLSKPLSVELMESRIPARLAYTALDGDPRVIPIGFLWTGGTLVCATIPASAKVKALQQNPRVAITIDTEDFPPKVLLIRGSATVEIVDGIPDEYITASHKVVPEHDREQWEAGVRHLYTQMAKITIEPDWAKLLDFETTLPKSVEDLIRQRGHPSG
jgi:Pyridoxamine 5'-phosphate oxidase